MSAPDRRARLDRDHERLSVRRQCALLGLARSGVYRAARAAREDDAAAMRRIDAAYTDHPFYGSRRIAFELKMSRKRVQRLMRLMGVAALGPKPRTSKPAPGHKVFPYLLRGVSIERPNQVWAADISVPQQAA
jgi:putative transposase